MENNHLMPASQRFFYRLGLFAANHILLWLLLSARICSAAFGADTPVEYRDDLEHFKYGSLGSEHEFGIPYWIWRALAGTV